MTFLLSYREGACKKMHILKLNRTGKFALNVVDNLVVFIIRTQRYERRGMSRSKEL